MTKGEDIVYSIKSRNSDQTMKKTLIYIDQSGQLRRILYPAPLEAANRFKGSKKGSITVV